MILIHGELVEKACSEGIVKGVPFTAWEGEDVYSALGASRQVAGVLGSVCVSTSDRQKFPLANRDNLELVRVEVVKPNDHKSVRKNEGALDLSDSVIKGYVWENDTWKAHSVEVIPVETELFSRNRGLLETDLVADKCVLVIAVGSVGSLICVELGKAGVRRFIIVEDDRLTVSNISRHQAGLSNVGRFKTFAVRDLILEINPYAEVITYQEAVSGENLPLIRELVRSSDLIINSADNRTCKRLINRICLAEKKPAIYAGCARRASSGTVLRVRPNEMCYQCFEQMLPETARDVEISRPEQLGVAYSDRPIDVNMIQPGLSLDIAPICHMASKIAMQELLRGKETCLRSLDEDLTPPYWFYINRREKGSQFEKLDPLKNSVDGMHILRWYGVDAKPLPDCSACGDLKLWAANQGVTQISAD